MFRYTSQPFMCNTLMQRVLPILWLVATLDGCTTTPKQRIAAEMVAPTGMTKDDAQYAIPTRSDRIGRIVVPVTINGQPDFHLMLDTGATHSVLTSKAASRLQLNVDEASISAVQGVFGQIDAHVLNIDQLQSGTLKLHNLRMPVIDGSVVSELDGILGAEGMEDKIITADFVHDRIRIADASSLHTNALYAVIKFALVSRRLVVVEGMVGRVPVRAVIDTGGTQTLGNLALLEALTKTHRKQQSADSGVIDITDKLEYGKLLLAPEIKLGPAIINNATIVFSDFGVFTVWHLDKRPTLLIGMDVLGQLAELSINYRRQELQVRLR